LTTNLFTEVRRRKVFQVAVVYAATGFAVLEAADVILPRRRRRARAPAGGQADRCRGRASGRTRDRARCRVVAAAHGPIGRRGRADRGNATLHRRPTVHEHERRPGQRIFSDGIAEELLNLLAKVPGLQVAARTSSFAFKGRNEDASDIARRLRVGHVLEGSVRRVGDRVRITAQLIEADEGFHLWSESYDRELADVFAVQDEIARAIVTALEAELGLGANTDLARASVTRDPRAHDLYLLPRWRRPRTCRTCGPTCPT
jgi:TolB-like protein